MSGEAVLGFIARHSNGAVYIIFANGFVHHIMDVNDYQVYLNSNRFEVLSLTDTEIEAYLAGK